MDMPQVPMHAQVHHTAPRTASPRRLNGEGTSPGLVDLVEDDDSLRNSMQDLLRLEGYTVRAWRDAQAYLLDLPLQAPAVVVTDMRMPGLSGLDLHVELQARGHLIPVIYISGESSVPQTISAMKLGAVDFLVKPFSLEDLLGAVARGLEIDRAQVLQQSVQARMDDVFKHLAPREREVLHLLVQGFSNAEIVEQLGVSLPTAKQYKAAVMRKLGVQSLSQLMKLHADLKLPDKQVD